MAEPFSVIILAGGFGRRLGRDKATCEAAGRPLLHWSVLAAAAVSDDLVVARRPDQHLPPLASDLTTVSWREAIDQRHDRGPLAGLEAALPLVQHQLALAIACDMPLIQPSLLRQVAAACQGVQIAMPRINDVPQPLLAAYRPSILPIATELLNSGEGRVRALLPHCNHRLIEADTLRSSDPDLQSFTNVNRPDDLELVGQLLTTSAQN